MSSPDIPSVHRPKGRRIRPISIGIIGVAVVAGGLVLLLSGFFTADAAEVVRVVDGDTVIVESDGDERRIRVLDIDTPETVDPSEPEECLGQESSRYTESVLPPGTVVELQFDHEGHDPYGRDLAVIRFDDGKSLAEELARRGLGVPYATGANDERREPVRDAFQEAASAGRGFFDDSIDCTLASGLQQLSANEAKIAELSAGSSSSDAAAAAASTVAIISSLSSLEAQLGIDAPIAVRAFILAGRRSEVDQARTAIEDLHQRQERFEKKASDRKKAEKKAKEAAKRKQRARRIAERNRRYNSAPQTPRATPPNATVPEPDHGKSGGSATKKRPAQSGKSGKSSSGSGGGYPGYTGPRCYAPGGKVWTPCPGGRAG